MLIYYFADVKSLLKLVISFLACYTNKNINITISFKKKQLSYRVIATRNNPNSAPACRLSVLYMFMFSENCLMIQYLPDSHVYLSFSTPLLCPIEVWWQGALAELQDPGRVRGIKHVSGPK